MKYSREIRVGVLAVICLCLLYFGLNFLKGINIFNPSRGYVGMFPEVNSLTEQSPVYIKGYKVGLVESIHYNFTQDTAFTVVVSINKDIRLPYGTKMALVHDGLISGMAIELRLPQSLINTAYYDRGDTLPSIIVPGLMDGLSDGPLAHMDSVMREASLLLGTLNQELADGSVHTALDHIASITQELQFVAADLHQFSSNNLPELSSAADSLLTNADELILELRRSELEQTIAHIDSMVQQVSTILSSKEGTLGLLLNDKSAYENLNKALCNIDSAVLNMDTVVMSVKAHPCIKKRIPK